MSRLRRSTAAAAKAQDATADTARAALVGASESLVLGVGADDAVLKNTVGMRDPRTRDWSRAVQEVWGRLVP